MQIVRVIAVVGATLRGPLTLKLSKEQIARRRPLLNEPDKSGVVVLDGDHEVQFKFGEELGVDSPDRLNKALFELIEDKPTKKRGRPRGSTAKKTADGDGKQDADTQKGQDTSPDPDAKASTDDPVAGSVDAATSIVTGTVLGESDGEASSDEADGTSETDDDGGEDDAGEDGETPADGGETPTDQDQQS